MRQLIAQPELPRVLHPGSGGRYELSRNEELKIAVLHGAEARGNGRADRRAVTLQNILPPFVGCGDREQVTMPRLDRHCQRKLSGSLSQYASNPAIVGVQPTVAGAPCSKIIAHGIGYWWGKRE